MDSQSSSGSRDRMGLERLAEELVAREGVGLPGVEHDLPVYVPLSHDNPRLSAPTFSVEDFLLSRSYTSLPDLRAELRDYLAGLKEELVKLINDDYEAFISLSTDLRGEGARLEKLKWPLSDLRAHVLESRGELQHMQDAIQQKLQKRTELREEKAFLHLLLKISESITRLESLLLISAPSDDDQGHTEIHGVTLASHHEEDRIEERQTRGNRAKHLSRVAAEYTQLLYHVAKAQKEKCAFVEECQWRIDRIKSTLSSDLDHLFSSTLLSLTEGKDFARVTGTSELDKTKALADVTECLRTYDVLGLWQDAEEVLRGDVVRTFVKKTIYSGCLSAPHSPVLPHTPFIPSNRPAIAQTAGSVPRTPYTPYTAFASKQNPFEASFESQPHILDETDDPLAALYNTILRFVDRDMRRIMEIAEKVGVKTVKAIGGKAALLGALPAQRGVLHGFEIMANVVWSEIGKAIMDELGSVVFAAGKPDEFRKHYETTQAFIRSLEYLAPSVDAVQAMRSHVVYTSFERRWQLPVYFQLRWKEIVTKLEDALAVTRLERTTSIAVAPFVTTQGSAVWVAISTVWSGQVYIPELNHRFWRLTLQIISRYKSWLEANMPALEPPNKFLGGPEKNTSPSLARAGTPTNQQVEAASPETVVSDDALLIQLATVLTDITVLDAQVWRLWREEIADMLPDLSEGGAAEHPISLEDTLRRSLSSLISLVPPISSQVIAILSRRGYDALLPMRSIPSQFRAMTASKRLPTEPSHFVSLIFRALKSFFGIGSGDAPGVFLKDAYLRSYAEEVFENVALRYIYFLTAMKKTEESLRRLKKGKKSAFSLFGSSASNKDDDGRADEEKIRAQMILDVQAFGKDAETLGVTANNSSTYRSLRELANAPLTDE